MIAAILLFLGGYSGAFASAAKIHVASNLSNNRVVLEISTAPRKLVSIDSSNGKSSEVKWPQNLKGEEVLALINSPSHLILISQWTSGGGKLPHIFIFNYKTSSWNEAGELRCRSFDTVSIKDNKLSAECEADALDKLGERTVTVQLPVSLSASGKWVFPISHSADAGHSFELHGSIFEWSAIEIHAPNTKLIKLTAADLSK